MINTLTMDGIRRATYRLPWTITLVLISNFCLYDLLGATGFVEAAKLRLCIVENRHITERINKTCSSLRTDKMNQVECVIANDRLNCMRRLINGEADFSILEPEDLVLASSNTDYNILVTHELRLFQAEPQRFAMVALVSSNIKSSSDLMGKRFCHAGLENSDDSTRISATYFQNWIIPRKCDHDKTLVENEISRLSEFFGSACIAGPWTADATLDSYLKSKYRNLCALCENPAGCYNNDKYHGRVGAVLCFVDNAADVAWVRQEDALWHFKSEGINQSEYNYLCPDGTTRSLDNSCVWITRPWPVVVASGDKAERVAKVVSSLSSRLLQWQIDVEELMESRYLLTPVSMETLQNPEDYLRKFPGFVSATARAGCPSRTIRWCVASNLEERKCQWLGQAALASGLEPSIECIQQPNRTACLQSVRTGRTDVFVVKPEEELEARLKGLKSLLSAFTSKKEDINVIGALVQKKSPYQKLEDLKGARACFTGYRSIGWNAFVDVMSNSSTNDSWNCSDLQAVSNFFKDSCVPKLKELKLDVPIPSNLYSLCEQDDDAGNSIAAAYACLTTGKANVAFVNLENGLNSLRNPSDKLRSMCNHADVPSTKQDPCFLTRTTLGSVIVNENMTELRREEIYSALLQLDVMFGKRVDDQTSAFSLYGPYDSNHDIIFSERTQHLQRDFDHDQSPRNYDALVSRFVEREKKYNYCSEANRPTGIVYNTLVAISLSTFLAAFTV